MKIAIIGATGKAGNLLLKEAAERGHEVAAIVRNAQKVTDSKVNVIEKDIFDLKADDLKPFDAIVNAFGAVPGQENLHVQAGRVLIDAMKGAPDTRLIVVGGAGSLYADEQKTTRVMDTADFPDEFIPTASNQGKNLEDLQQSQGFHWTFISPSAIFDPSGEKTGYRTGEDVLLVNTQGESYLSYADFATAALDEIEQPKHLNQRYTVISN
ncbi:NAD(P)-dependent oxidoreductase [Bacillus sp. 1P06AnD]|uniref:NAD(P)-dependent oxidoreductase n=1 Tax=Bacillus sp. 1P06AnD TaxID=3132208 RepID=UPI0039A13BB4